MWPARGRQPRPAPSTARAHIAKGAQERAPAQPALPVGSLRSWPCQSSPALLLEHHRRTRRSVTSNFFVSRPGQPDWAADFIPKPGRSHGQQLAKPNLMRMIDRLGSLEPSARRRRMTVVCAFRRTGVDAKRTALTVYSRSVTPRLPLLCSAPFQSSSFQFASVKNPLRMGFMHFHEPARTLLNHREAF